MYLKKVGFVVSLYILLSHSICSAEDPTEADYCDAEEHDNSMSEDSVSEPSICQEVIVNDTPALYNQDDYNILAALATSVLNKTYPTRVDAKTSFSTYDEMPHPIPTGASSYFMVLFTVIFTWYFNKYTHWLLKDTEAALELYPKPGHFPNIHLYLLQQSRRESDLNRENRNSWAWLANYYLLKPSDAFVNPDEVFRGGWADRRDVWDTIKAVLQVNALEELSDEEDTYRRGTVSESEITHPANNHSNAAGRERRSTSSIPKGNKK